MDQLACNYDPDANFNVQEMCCYPGLCNDRDLDIVCPSLSTGNRVFQVYPNPTSNDVNIFIKGDNSEKMKVELYNQYGLLLSVRQFNIFGQNTFNMELNSLDHGVYMLKVITDNEIYNSTIIKQ
jgi:hypothetical protein